jgi:hypothetical protein
MEADSTAPKMPRELAEKEVNSWLDYKRVKPSKREDNKDSIDSLIDSFMDGSLSLNPDTSEITLKLNYPVTSNNIDKLVFKPRLKVGEIHKRLANVKSTDGDARVMAYVSALTGQNTGVIADMDSGDYSIAQPIVIFFF